MSKTILEPFDVSLYFSKGKSPNLSLDEIKGIIISVCHEYNNNCKEFEHYFEVGAIKTGETITVAFTVTNTDQREERNYFHWLTSESTSKLIEYINEMCDWAAHYKFTDIEPEENWERKYNNKD